jgi:hypothetical protein
MAVCTRLHGVISNISAAEISNLKNTGRQQETNMKLLARRAGFVLGLSFRPWRWKRYAPPKCRLTFNGLYAVISQQTASLLANLVITSNPTNFQPQVQAPGLCFRVVWRCSPLNQSGYMLWFMPTSFNPKQRARSPWHFYFYGYIPLRTFSQFGARGSVVCSDTMLQAKRSRVRFQMR